MCEDYTGCTECSGDIGDVTCSEYNHSYCFNDYEVYQAMYDINLVVDTKCKTWNKEKGCATCFEE